MSEEGIRYKGIGLSIVGGLAVPEWKLGRDMGIKECRLSRRILKCNSLNAGACKGLADLEEKKAMKNIIPGP